MVESISTINPRKRPTLDDQESTRLKKLCRARMFRPSPAWMKSPHSRSRRAFQAASARTVAAGLTVHYKPRLMGTVTCDRWGQIFSLAGVKQWEGYETNS